MGIEYNPGIRPETHSMALGLATFGNAISQAMDERTEEEKKRAQLTKTLRSYAAQAGIMPKEQAEVLGMEDLQGAVQGAHFKQTLEDAKERSAVRAEQLKALLAGNKATAALPEFARAYSEQSRLVGPQMPGGAVNAALAAAPDAAGSPQLDKLLMALQRGGAGGDQPPQVAMPGGIPTVWKPGSQAFQIDPAYGIEKRTAAASELEGQRQTGRKDLMDYHESLRPKVKIKSDPNQPGKYLVEGDPGDVQAFAESSLRLNTLHQLKAAKASGAKTVRIDPATGEVKVNPWMGLSEPIDSAIDRLNTGGPGVQTSGGSAPVPGAGSRAPAGTSDKIIVMKDGKQFRLPPAQLQQALKEGYTEVAPAE